MSKIPGIARPRCSRVFVPFFILLALTAEGLTQCRNTVFLWVRDLIILIFKLLRAKLTAENQYASLRSALSDAIRRQSWKVEQISFVTGSLCVNKQDLRSNLKFFQVPEASIESIYSKLMMRVFDVHAKILQCMYSTRFSGGSARSSEAQSTSNAVTPLIRTLDTSRRISTKGSERKVTRQATNNII